MSPVSTPQPERSAMPPPTAARPALTVVVASYEVRDLLRECLKSLAVATAALGSRVVVVDNGSSDGSAAMVAEEFPWVDLIDAGDNLGFARANNRALRSVATPWVLLLNPDTVVPEGTLEPMVDFLVEHPDVGMVGPRLVRPDGRLDDACKRGFPTPWNALARCLALDRAFPKSRLFGSYRKTWVDPESRCEVDSVVGAFMLLRREALEQVGGFDEDFFMFGEDLDWCFRFQRHDWRVFYLGDACAVHHKGAATVQRPFSMAWHFHRSMLVFHRKHLDRRYPFFVNGIVYLGIFARYGVATALAFGRLAWRRVRGPARVAESV